MFEILNRFTSAILFHSEAATTATEALAEANLGYANLGGADLRYANLGGANLGGADLRYANLRYANLGYANLGGAKGLLRDGLLPLQIFGTHDPIIVRTPGFVTIGCEHHELTWWEEHYKAVGRRENYSDEQVSEYAAHIAHARAWMQAYGVAGVEKKAEEAKTA